MPTLRKLVVGLATLALTACAVDQGTEDSARAVSQPIIKGAASATDQDYVVQLAFRYTQGIFPSCSATVIAKNVVLTARHCVGEVHDDGSVTDYPAEVIRVYTGRDAPRRIATGAEANTVGKQLFVLPNKFMIPDVAVVVLKDALDVPIAPIRLDGGAQKDELLDIVGFGIDENDARPEYRMQRKGVRVLELGPGKTDYHDLFAGEFVFGEAACSGDSGGPALSATTNAVVGVASRVSNGQQRSDQNPSGFCVGTGAEDVYTSLEPAKGIIEAAFAAAGAKPILEGEAPPVVAKDAGAPAPEPAAAPDTAPTRTHTSTPTSSAGCAAAPRPSSPSAAGVALLALAIGAAGVRRRAPGARVPR